MNSLLIAGVVGGISIYLLRRYTPGEKTDLDDIVWTASGDLSFRRCLGTAAISEIVIGLGASLGREAAPKLLGGAWASVLGRRFGLSAAQQRLLIACGGGAGLACVYDVPLGGAFFTVAAGLAFGKEMTGGKGFIALAAMILGRWSPMGALAAALLFGFADNLQVVLGIIGTPIPSQIMLMTPYVVTIFAVAGLVGRVRAPAAEGVPYVK